MYLSFSDAVSPRGKVASLSRASGAAYLLLVHTLGGIIHTLHGISSQHILYRSNDFPLKFSLRFRPSHATQFIQGYVQSRGNLNEIENGRGSAVGFVKRNQLLVYFRQLGELFLAVSSQLSLVTYCGSYCSLVHVFISSM